MPHHGPERAREPRQFPVVEGAQRRRGRAVEGQGPRPERGLPGRRGPHAPAPPVGRVRRFAQPAPGHEPGQRLPARGRSEPGVAEQGRFGRPRRRQLARAMYSSKNSSAVAGSAAPTFISPRPFFGSAPPWPAGRSPIPAGDGPAPARLQHALPPARGVASRLGQPA